MYEAILAALDMPKGTPQELRLAKKALAKAYERERERGTLSPDLVPAIMACAVGKTANPTDQRELKRAMQALRSDLAKLAAPASDPPPSAPPVPCAPTPRLVIVPPPSLTPSPSADEVVEVLRAEVRAAVKELRDGLTDAFQEILSRLPPAKAPRASKTPPPPAPPPPADLEEPAHVD